MKDESILINFSDLNNNVLCAYEYLVAKMNEIQKDERWNIYWTDV